MILLKINWAPSEKLFEIGGFGIHVLQLDVYNSFFIRASAVQKNVYEGKYRPKNT